MRGEDVISIRGEVRERERPTDKVATGAVEVYVSDVEVLAVAETTPFVVSENDPRATTPSDEVALTYRYLDLRRSRLQRNLLLQEQAVPVGAELLPRSTTSSRSRHRC